MGKLLLDGFIGIIIILNILVGILAVRKYKRSGY